MNVKRGGLLVSLLALLVFPLLPSVKGMAPCHRDRLIQWAVRGDCADFPVSSAFIRAVLEGGGPYESTYVILYVDQLGFRIESIDDPVLSGLRVGVLEEANAERLLEKHGIVRRISYPMTFTGMCSIFRDVLQGRIDAAIVWAPLAGYFAQFLDPETRLNMTTVGERLAPPPLPFNQSGKLETASDTIEACRREIQGTLQAYGAVPVALILPQEEQAVIPEDLVPPPEDIREAAEGWRLYHLYCDRCHGIDAVSGGLAPDLRQSMQRLSYAEVFQTVLKGRVEKGMPAWQGVLKEAQVRAIYQYLRARSQGKLGAGKPLVSSNR